MLREKFCINIIFDSQLSLRQWEDAKKCADWVKQLYLVVLITTQQLAYMSPDIDASCSTGIKLGTPVLMVTRLSRLIAHSHKDELLLENVVLEEVFFSGHVKHVAIKGRRSASFEARSNRILFSTLWMFLDWSCWTTWVSYPFTRPSSPWHWLLGYMKELVHKQNYHGKSWKLLWKEITSFVEGSWECIYNGRGAFRTATSIGN
jgi:hypothetical protein